MTRLVNDISTRLFLNSAWRDISGDVRYSSGVAISRGRRMEDDTTPPSSCNLVLDNNSGDYTERDPTGTWYGYLGRNTPLEVALRLAKDTCSSTVSNGWGTTELDSATDPAWTAYTWSTSGGSAGDYAKASGKATHLISTAAQNRITYLAALSQRDIDVTLSLSLSFTDIVGGNLATDILLRGQSTSVFYAVRMRLVAADESIQVEVQNGAGTVLSSAVTVSGVTHSSSQALHMRVQIEGRTIRVKVWQGTNRETTEPYDWAKTFNDENLAGDSTAIVDAAGFVGIRSTVGSGNTNVPITFSYDNIDIRSPRFAGEVSEWPQQRDVTGNDRTVAIEAASIQRRLSQGGQLHSALYRFVTMISTGNPTAPVAYWPLEDEARADVTRIIAAAGNGQLDFVQPLSGVSVGTIEWAGDKNGLPGSHQSPTMSGGGGLIADIDPPAGDPSWAVSWCEKMNDTDGSYSLLATTSFRIQFTITLAANATVLNIKLDGPGFTVDPFLVHNFVDKEDAEAWHHYVVVAEQNGANMDGELWVDGVLVDTTTRNSLTLNGLAYVEIGTNDSSTTDTAVGHIGVWNNTTTLDIASLYDASQGWPGEKGIERAYRLCTEDDVEFAWIGRRSSSPDGQPMGAQRVTTFTELLDDAEQVDGGLLTDQRGVAGFRFRTLRSMYSRSSWLELNLATSKHFSPPLQPTSDDRFIVNDITVRRVDGGEYHAEVSTGRLSTLSPAEGGIGRYTGSATLNVQSDEQLPAQAGWRLHLGTVDEERYPQIVLELHRSEIYTDTALLAKLRDLDVGDQITLSGLASLGIYDDRDELVVGYAEYLSRFEHTLSPACFPASPLRIWTPGSNDEYALTDSDYTTLAEDLDTSETGVDVTIATGRAFWSTSAGNYPMDLMVGGEVMTASACTSPSGQNQTFTVTRNVNGLPGGKTHSTGAKISLARPNYLGL